MKKVKKKLTCGSYKAVRAITKLTRFHGIWVELDNCYQYRTAERAFLNYWTNTGTISFQGNPAAVRKLKARFLKRAVVISSS